MTPHHEIPPSSTWAELIAFGWRHGWLSMRPADPKKVRRAEQNREQYERRKGRI